MDVIRFKLGTVSLPSESIYKKTPELWEYLNTSDFFWSMSYISFCLVILSLTSQFDIQRYESLHSNTNVSFIVPQVERHGTFLRKIQHGLHPELERQCFLT